MPEIIKVNITVRDKRGRIITRRTQPAHSFVQNWIIGVAGGLGNVSCVAPFQQKDTGGNVVSQMFTSNNASENVLSKDAGPAGGGDVTYGIVVGSNATLPVYTNTQVGTLITNGVGAGQLVYAGQAFTQPYLTGANTVNFNASRTLTNNSGGVVTIKEVGLISKSSCAIAGGKKILILHDHVADIAVPDTASVTVQYVWSTTT